MSGVKENQKDLVVSGEIEGVISLLEFSNSKGKPGTILNENLEIGCSENSIRVLEIQREGKKPQKTSEFMLGTQMKKGTNLNDL